MMKRHKSLIILFIIGLISIGFSLGAYFLIQPSIVKKQKDVIISEAKAVFKSEIQFDDVKILKKEKDPKSILEKAEIISQQEIVGYYFKARKDNSFGTIEITLGIDINQIIINVNITVLEQTMYQENTKKSAESYKGKNLDKQLDAQTGATSVSINTLDSLVKDISEANRTINRKEVLPYAMWYQDGYEVETKENVTENIKKIEVIKNKGTVYTVTLSGNWQVNKEKETITAVIGLDQSGTILGILLPLESYNHSQGNFYDIVITYAKTFTGKGISTITDAQTAPSEGAGNSRNTLLDIVRLVKDYREKE